MPDVENEEERKLSKVKISGALPRLTVRWLCQDLSRFNGLKPASGEGTELRTEMNHRRVAVRERERENQQLPPTIKKA